MKIRYFTLPNILTLANLLCGSLALVYALAWEDLRMAFIFIIAGAMFDFLDGFAARLLRSYSELGKQLDSLSDMVSFGVAPSVILYVMFLSSGGNPYVAFVVFIVALFSALRLARFNIDDTQHEEFLGLPTPACAIFISSAGWLYAAGVFTIAPWMIAAWAILLAAMLIAPVRMFSLKFSNFSFRDNIIRYTFVFFSLAGILIFGMTAVPLVIVFYVLLSIGRNFACRKSL